MKSRTLQYRLKHLVTRNRIVMDGAGRWPKFRMPDTANRCGVPEDAGEPVITFCKAANVIRNYVRQPPQARKPVGYDHKFLDRYRPNISAYLTKQDRAHLTAIDRHQIAEQAAGTHAKHILSVAAIAVMLQFLTAAPIAVSQELQNLTGLPVYPHLKSATMDRVPKTDVLGHWCTRLTADTYDSLDAVQEWYRKALAGASETDLTHDEYYKAYTELSGIKLSLGLDFVDIYKSAPQAITAIQLVKCSPAT